MNAITVRNLPPAVAKAVKEKARKEGLSLNKAVLKLLEEATGQGPAKASKPVVHHDLDHLFGVWTKEEADEFDAFLKEHRSIIDPEMWK
jgi:hypothetical protein